MKTAGLDAAALAAVVSSSAPAAVGPAWPADADVLVTLEGSRRDPAPRPPSPSACACSASAGSGIRW